MILCRLGLHWREHIRGLVPYADGYDRCRWCGRMWFSVPSFVPPKVDRVPDLRIVRDESDGDQ